MEKVKSWKIPGQKTGNISDITSINSPGQRIGQIVSYDLTSRKKLEITLAFSIVEASLREKATTNTTSCNGWNTEVRQQVWKEGKITGKSPKKRQG